VSEFAGRAAEKLRKQDSHAGQVLVFAHTSPHRSGPRFHRSVIVPLRRPTADAPALVRAAVAGLHQIFESGYELIKAAVILIDLTLGRRCSKSRRSAQESCPFMRADCTRFITMAARWPASSLPTNIHADRDPAEQHTRRRESDPGSGDRSLAIVVHDHPTPALIPGKCALDDPALGQEDEALNASCQSDCCGSCKVPVELLPRRRTTSARMLWASSMSADWTLT